MVIVTRALLAANRFNHVPPFPLCRYSMRSSTVGKDFFFLAQVGPQLATPLATISSRSESMVANE